MVPTLRIGLVGFGSWTRDAYLPALQQSGRASVVAAAAPSEMTRERIRGRLGDSVQIYDGVQGILNGPKMDALMIAVPDPYHEATLSAALAAGLPVLYEPPLTHCREHLPRMLGRLLSVPQVTHADLELGYIPAVRRAARLVQTGVLGKIETVQMRLRASWQAEAENDLSTIGRLTPWYVDVLNTVIGSTPRRVFVIDGRVNVGRAQNFSVAHFDYDRVWGTFDVNIASFEELTVTLQGQGTHGEFALDLFSGEVRFRTRANTGWTIESLPAERPYAGWPGVHESIAAFLESVAEKKPSSNSALKMAQLNLVALAAEEAKDTATWANVSETSSGFASRW